MWSDKDMLHSGDGFTRICLVLSEINALKMKSCYNGEFDLQNDFPQRVRFQRIQSNSVIH